MFRTPASICLSEANAVCAPRVVVGSSADFRLPVWALAESSMPSRAAARVIAAVPRKWRRSWLALADTLFPPLFTSAAHEVPDDLRNLIRCGIEREMTRIEDVDLGLRHVAAIGLGLRELERLVVLAPQDEKPRLLFAHPGLPPGVGVDVRAVVVEEVALDVGLAGLVEKGEFIRPEIRVVAFDVWVAPDMAR